jgi:hypothetical protein
VVQQREGLCLTGEDSLGEDQVRGQLTPSAEARTGEAVDAVLAVSRQVEQVRGAVRMGQLPVGDRELFREHRHAVNVEHRRAAAGARGAGGRGMQQRHEVVVVAGGERARHAVVTQPSGGGHRII